MIQDAAKTYDTCNTKADTLTSCIIVKSALYSDEVRSRLNVVVTAIVVTFCTDAAQPGTQSFRMSKELIGDKVLCNNKGLPCGYNFCRVRFFIIGIV